MRLAGDKLIWLRSSRTASQPASQLARLDSDLDLEPEFVAGGWRQFASKRPNNKSGGVDRARSMSPYRRPKSSPGVRAARQRCSRPIRVRERPEAEVHKRSRVAQLFGSASGGRATTIRGLILRPDINHARRLQLNA